MEAQEAINLAPFVVEIYRNRSEMECNLIHKETGEMSERLPVTWKSRENKLDYLSVSKIQAYEQCPACFYHQYMASGTETIDNGNFFTEFGSILHEVVEMAYKYYRDTGLTIDPISLLDQSWKSHNLTGLESYCECKQLITEYFTRYDVTNRPDNPVFIEHEWRGELGGCTFGLVIDYAGIMKSDPSIGVLRDYKSNRMPFTPQELDYSLQLRIYEIILRRYLAPDVKTWISGYEMFRFGWQQCPERTQDDLDSAETYVSNIWHQISNDNKWEEKLNNYCGYRNCRFTCKAYNDYVNDPRRHIEHIMIDSTDIAAIERSRKELAACEKIAKQRKDECAKIVEGEIMRAAEQGNKLIIDGEQLEMFSNATESYRFYDTRNVLMQAGKLDMLESCLSIGKTKFDALLKKSGDKSLILQLAGCKDQRFATPYVVSRKIK